MASVLKSGLLWCALSAPFAQSDVMEAAQALRTGEYHKIESLLSSDDRKDPQVALVLGQAYRFKGEYEKAEEIVRDALKGHSDNRSLSVLMAKVYVETGRSNQAIDLLTPLVEKSASISSASDTVGSNTRLEAIVTLGDILYARGRFDDAKAYLQLATLNAANSINFSSVDAAMIARAYWLLENFQEANRFYREAIRLDRFNSEAHIAWGDLFSEKYNRAEAMQSYQEVLSYNPNHPMALVGLAKVTRETKPLEKALYANPRAAEVFVAHADLAVKQHKYGEAKSFLNAALPNNPESLMAVSLLAAIALIESNHDEYELMLKRAQQIQPGGGFFHSTIADVMANDYLFEEAVSHARKAIAQQPTYWPAHTLLGMNLIRLGNEAEGRKVLELAYEKDPYNLWASNMLKVLDSMDTFVTLENDTFQVKMSEHDATVLWPYMEPLLVEAWEKLTKKYQFTPEGPVLIEVFDQREDFAVRSVGLPDIGPLVGICFGKVITLISPDTLTANWQEIVWHEFVHIITLQMTNNRIPRWLSEGVSVYEEFQGRDEWGRRQNLDVARAMQTEHFFPIERIDDAFLLARSDDDLNLAYLQSYLVVEFIVQTYGFEKLLDMLNAYRDEHTVQGVLSTALNKKPKSFDNEFNSWLAQRMAKVDVYVDEDDMADNGAGHGHGVRSNSSALLAEQYSADSLKRYMLERIENQPRDFQAHLQLGIVLFKEDNYVEAKKHLLKAKEILPYYTGYPSPPVVLAQLYEAMGDSEKHLAELAYVAKYHQHDVKAPMVLAEHAENIGDYEKAEYYLNRILAVDPYRIDVHQRYARLADKNQQHKASIREYEIITKLDASDPASAYTKLADAYMKGGLRDKAKHSSLRALEVAPTFAPAQRILLEAIE